MTSLVLRCAADFLIFIKALTLGATKTGRLGGSTCLMVRRLTASTVIIGCRVGCRADVDAGLLPQTVHQRGQVRAEGRRAAHR